MRQRKQPSPKIAKVVNGFGQVAPTKRTEVVCLGVLTDGKNQAKLGKAGEEAFEEVLGAFAARGEIAAAAAARIAKAHGDDGDPFLVVEDLRFDPHPFA